MTVALPMYDLPEVAADLDAFWEVLRSNVVEIAGIDGPLRRHRPRDLHRSWQAPDLLLSQTCGYPLVGALGSVHVVGAFVQPDPRSGDGNAAATPAGHHRSVIVARRGAAARAQAGEWRGLRAAVNDRWSLSGWISLLVAAGHRAPWPGEEVITGGHRASLAALRSAGADAADVASIDAVTFGLIEQHAPEELEGIAIVGRGPLVPALPLITRRVALVEAWRQALALTLATARLAPSLGRLRIAGFVAFDRGDYDPVAALAATVAGALPPWPGSQRSSSERSRTPRNGGA